MDERNIETYVEHPGTIRVSGSSIPRSTGKCAFHYLSKNLLPDFLVIGGNANQQATKAMGVFCFLVKHSPEFAGAQVAFEPLLFNVHTADSDGTPHIKSATVWRTVLFQPK